MRAIDGERSGGDELVFDGDEVGNLPIWGEDAAGAFTGDEAHQRGGVDQAVGAGEGGLVGAGVADLGL